MDLLYNRNTGVVELNGLKNGLTEQFENDATVAATIQYQGEDVSGETWPLAMAYVTASDGIYRGLLSAGLDLTNGKTHTATVTAVTTDGLEGEWICKVVPQDRPC